MALGVDGWVSGMTNAWPAECVEIFNLCAAGEFAEARELYRILTPSFHLDTHVKLVQYIKLAEHVVYGAPEWARARRDCRSLATSAIQSSRPSAGQFPLSIGAPGRASGGFCQAPRSLRIAGPTGIFRRTRPLAERAA